MIRVELSEEEQRRVRALAERRMNPDRHFSATRSGQSKLSTQLVGATGEFAVRAWLRDAGLTFDDRGLVSDDTELPDVVVNGLPVEIMSAQARHRDTSGRYGFGYAVPDNKFQWHARRGIWGYLFVDVPAVRSSNDPPPIPYADIAHAAPLDLVAAATVRDDKFRNRRLEVPDMTSPEQFLRLVRTGHGEDR